MTGNVTVDKLLFMIISGLAVTLITTALYRKGCGYHVTKRQQTGWFINGALTYCLFYTLFN